MKSAVLSISERESEMYIINKSKTQIANLEQITSLYIGGDECSIKADFITGKGCQIARYSSRAAATTALELLGRAIGRAEVFFMPDDEAVLAQAKADEQKWHHATGKKTKGHGGS